VSFFDEDDEPLRTTPRPRPRPRRGSPAGGAVADQQQIYIRRAVFGLLIVLVVVLLGLFVKSCSDSRAKSALRDYNTKVSALATESQDTGVSFFKHFASGQPSATQLQTAINGDKATADTTLKQAQGLDVPGSMVSAQQSLLIALELRRDALGVVAQNIRTALGDSGEQADAAIKKIASQMSALNASDVLWSARVSPLINKALIAKGIVQNITVSQFVKDVSWLSPQFVAQKLDQQLTSGNAGANSGTGKQQPTGPGLHGTGLNSTSVGSQTLTPGAPNQITYTPGMTFFVAFTNQGENDEFNIKVTVRIESAHGSPVTLTTTVASVPKGTKATAQLKLNRTPPLNTAATIRVNVAPVPGEKKTDNNQSSYPALFKR
jgi:adhesin HecA-like repeat protein